MPVYTNPRPAWPNSHPPRIIRPIQAT